MLVLPDDILFQIAETQKSDPNFVSDEVSSVKPKRKIKAIIRRAFTKKEPELGHYSKSYYQDTFDFLIKTQSEFWDKLNRFALGSNYLQDGNVVEEDYSYITKIPKDNEDEADSKCPPCPGPLNNGFISRIFKVIKKIYNVFSTLLSIKRWYNRGRKLYNLIKNWGKSRRDKIKKFYQTVKKWFGRNKRRLFKFWKKRVKPLLKRLWNWLKRKFRKAKRLLKKAFNKFKKLFNRFKKWILKTVKKILIKAFKKVAKTLAKQLIKWVLRIVAGALTATGIGAIIGTAIIAATWAWDAYDMTRPEEPEPDDEDAELDEDELSEVDEKEEARKQKQILDQSKPSTPANPTKPFTLRKHQDYKVKYREDGRVKMGNGEGRHKDAVIEALYDNGNDYFIIFGSLYEFYQYCFKWLEGQEEFGIKNMAKITSEINSLISKINDFCYNKLDYKEELWLPWFIEKYKFNPFNNRNRTKPGQPKKWEPDNKISVVDKFISERWNHGQGNYVIPFNVRSNLGKEYITKNIQLKRGEKDDVNYAGGSSPGKWIKRLIPLLKESNEELVKQYPKYESYNPADISNIDNVKLVNVESLMSKYTKSLQIAKTSALNDKNILLYDMWNRAAWIENCFNKSMIESGKYSK